MYIELLYVLVWLIILSNLHSDSFNNDKTSMSIGKSVCDKIFICRSSHHTMSSMNHHLQCTACLYAIG